MIIIIPIFNIIYITTITIIIRITAITIITITTITPSPLLASLTIIITTFNRIIPFINFNLAIIIAIPSLGISSIFSFNTPSLSLSPPFASAPSLSSLTPSPFCSLSSPSLLSLSPFSSPAALVLYHRHHHILPSHHHHHQFITTTATILQHDLHSHFGVSKPVAFSVFPPNSHRMLWPRNSFSFMR